MSLSINAQRCIAIAGALLCSAIALSPLIPNKSTAEEPVIRFFVPGEGRYIDYGEYSFSAPRPIVIIDPVVLGSARDHPNNSTVEQIGPDHMLVRITGVVYDFLGDVVAENKADIETVTFSSSLHGSLPPVPLTRAPNGRDHPYFDVSSLGVNIAIRPYAYRGHFELKERELRISTGYNSISVQATDMNQGTGTATLKIKANVNHDLGSYELELGVHNGMDAELLNPVAVHINDPDVTPDNIDSAFAYLNGKRVGLRYVDGQLQLDRPIIGIGRATPPDSIPNVVNVTGVPNCFLVRYKDEEAEFHWSYTR